MSESEPIRRTEKEAKKEFGITMLSLEANDGEKMLDIYTLYRDNIPGSILSVEPKKLPKSYIHHLLRDVRKMEDPDSEDIKFNWESDISPNSFLWISRVLESDELTVRFSFNVADFIYLSDDAQNDVVVLKHEFNNAVNDYLEESGVGVEL